MKVNSFLCGCKRNSSVHNTRVTVNICATQKPRLKEKKDYLLANFLNDKREKICCPYPCYVNRCRVSRQDRQPPGRIKKMNNLLLSSFKGACKTRQGEILHKFKWRSLCFPVFYELDMCFCYIHGWNSFTYLCTIYFILNSVWRNLCTKLTYVDLWSTEMVR